MLFNSETNIGSPLFQDCEDKECVCVSACEPVDCMLFQRLTTHCFFNPSNYKRNDFISNMEIFFLQKSDVIEEYKRTRKTFILPVF
jgi:hypothetical protein